MGERFIPAVTDQPLPLWEPCPWLQSLPQPAALAHLLALPPESSFSALPCLTPLMQLEPPRRRWAGCAACSGGTRSRTEQSAVSRPGAGDTYVGHGCRVNTLYWKDIAQLQAIISWSLIRPPDVGAWLHTQLPGQELAVLSSCRSSPAQEAAVEAVLQSE